MTKNNKKIFISISNKICGSCQCWTFRVGNWLSLKKNWCNQFVVYHVGIFFCFALT